MRPDAVTTLCRVGDDTFPSFADTLNAAPMHKTMTSAMPTVLRKVHDLFGPEVVEVCASCSFTAHSSQQTSTVCPPTVTLIGFPSSLQSQAAHVDCFIQSSSVSSYRRGAVGHVIGTRRYRDL